MATGKALDGKPYAGNPHVRFDEGEVAAKEWVRVFKDAEMKFPVRADRVPANVRLAVKPLDSFQREGRAIFES